MGAIKQYLGIAVVGFLAYTFFLGGPSGPQSADLGKVLDRTEYAIERYSAYAEQNKFEQIGEEQIAEFNGFLTTVMNTQPTFYDNTIGVSMNEVAAFEGYDDANSNGTQDSGEGDLFTVEIDAEGRRLIATDETGSTHKGFSGTGLLAGLLIGNLLSRQKAGGVNPGSFANRQSTARSAYKAPSSARSRSRSGGLGKGK